MSERLTCFVKLGLIGSLGAFEYAGNVCVLGCMREGCDVGGRVMLVALL